MPDLSLCLVSVLKQNQSPFENGQAESMGMGFLISTDRMMTCTHVVMSALNAQTASAIKGGSLQVEVGVCSANSKTVTAKVEKYHGFKDSGAGHSLEDTCILKFDELLDFPLNVTLFDNHSPQQAVQMFGFGLADSAQDSQSALDRGRWVDGKCMGPNRDWEQINTQEREVLRGYSGGPVFNATRDKILGMLVARDAGDKITHMIRASTLCQELPSDQPIIRPIVSVLSRVLDRTEQSETLHKFTTNGVAHCFVLECSEGDAPELFAHKLKVLAHMSKMGLKQLVKEAIEPIHFAFPSTGRSLIRYIEGEVEEDVINWLTKNRQLKVAFVSSSDGRNIVSQLKRITEGVKQINQQLEESRDLAPFIVIVPFYRDQFNWLSAKMTQYQISQLHNEGVLTLPKLGEIARHHLRVFISELPKAARKDFEAKFDAYNIDQDFYQCMQDKELKKYREILPDFEQILQKRMQQEQL